MAQLVIDLDTGTVLGCNLVAVSVDDEDILESIMSSDSFATDFGEKYGVSLYIENDLVTSP